MLIPIVFALFLIIVGYIALDQPISLWCSKLPLGSVKAGKLLSWLSAPEIHLTAWPILFLLFFYLLRKKKVGSRLLLTVLSVPSSILAGDIMKVIFGRVRPYEWLKSDIYGFTWLSTKQRFFSFPSSHATVIGAVMGSLACFFPKYRLLWFLTAFCLATPRVFALEHYFSDIVAGITIGFIASYLIDKKMHDTLPHRILNLFHWRNNG